MRQKLFHLYNRLKKSFVDEITDIVRHKKQDVCFNPHIRIDKVKEDGIMYDEISCLHYDDKEKMLYVYLQEVEVDVIAAEKHDYWVPLKDMSFDEIFKIAEAL